MAVVLGPHTLVSTQPFGAFVYGFADFDSYGYPGGLSLAPIAQVMTVTLTPKTSTTQVGTQHCVTGAVKDQNGVGLPGIRVDFSVSGTTTASQSVGTNAEGVAQSCYSSTTEGDDVITAVVGTLRDTAANRWMAETTTTTTSTTLPAKVRPAFVTRAASAAIGQPVSDTAMVTGPQGASAPTGTVGFSLFDNPTCAGPPRFVSGNRPLSAGRSATATSESFTPAAVGEFRWIASYSGDANYLPVTGACGDPDETSVVSKADPALVTQAASATWSSGTSPSIHDVATLSGGFHPTGTIAFSAFGPDDAACAGTATFTSVKPAAGNGEYTSDSFAFAEEGTYRWVVTYSGDANNNPCSLIHI